MAVLVFLWGAARTAPQKFSIVVELGDLMLRTVGIVIAVALLAGCAEFDNFMENIEQLPPGTTLQKAKRTTPEADAHNMQLYSGYIGLSQAEYDEGDYRDSDYFADRAIASAGNIKVDPQRDQAPATLVSTP